MRRDDSSWGLDDRTWGGAVPAGDGHRGAPAFDIHRGGLTTDSHWGGLHPATDSGWN
ncbi:hypothetical protein [Kitasatospora griseola]|uniref:hypothetical protein n=1 Tax=Kitasatospora griseola TaxID=2064 RepID=UPI0038096BD4